MILNKSSVCGNAEHVPITHLRDESETLRSFLPKKRPVKPTIQEKGRGFVLVGGLVGRHVFSGENDASAAVAG
jgi:hypothetical protein